jgi:uncharacterized protein YhhL (DUF1145 family)
MILMKLIKLIIVSVFYWTYLIKNHHMSLCRTIVRFIYLICYSYCLMHLFQIFIHCG